MGVNPQTASAFKHAARRLPPSPPPRPKTAHEQAEEKARSAFFSVLTPEFFSHQISNTYCQTEVYDLGLGTEYKNVYSCIFKTKGTWLLIDIKTSDQGVVLDAADEEDSILLLEDAMSRLKIRDDAHRKISKNIVVSKDDLKNTHYTYFSKQQGLCIDQKGLYHKKNTQGHIIKETTFSLNTFNQKPLAENVPLEEHVTALFEHLVKNYLYKRFQDDIAFLKESDVQCSSLENKDTSSLLSAIWGTAAYDKEYFAEADFYERIKGRISDVLSIISTNSPCALYVVNELKAVPFRTDCDWSKIPKIQDMITKEFQKMKKEYQGIYEKMCVAPKAEARRFGVRMLE